MAKTPTNGEVVPLTPDEQKQRFAELCERLETDSVERDRTDGRPKSNLGAEHLTPEQRHRFDEPFRELDTDNGEALDRSSRHSS